MVRDECFCKTVRLSKWGSLKSCFHVGIWPRCNQLETIGDKSPIAKSSITDKLYWLVQTDSEWLQHCFKPSPICLRLMAVSPKWTTIVWRQVASHQVICTIKGCCWSRVFHSQRLGDQLFTAITRQPQILFPFAQNVFSSTAKCVPVLLVLPYFCAFVCTLPFLPCSVCPLPIPIPASPSVSQFNTAALRGQKDTLAPAVHPKEDSVCDNMCEGEKRGGKKGVGALIIHRQCFA